jgi:hypothetical protein
MLSDNSMTVADKIRSLAEETGAPSVFVAQVRSLFETKRISLEDDCSPYITALEEAFRREAAIRRDTLIANDNLARLQENFANLGAKYKEQLSRLQRARKTAPTRSIRRSTDSMPGHKSYISRKESETLPMVPGPKEVQ